MCVCVCECVCVTERERERVRILLLCLPQASTYAVLVQTLSGEIGDSPVSSPSYFNTSEGGKFCAFCKISTQPLYNLPFHFTICLSHFSIFIFFQSC